jgi:hypothetical protein
MWLVLKLKNMNKLSELKKSMNDLLGNTSEFYLPKIKKNIFKNNGRTDKNYYILENYVFVFNKKFIERDIIKNLYYLRGLQYILNGFKSSQDEIIDFIKNCKKNENSEGHLMQSFFDIFFSKSLKFSSGPFTNYVTEIIRVQKSKINVLIGNYTVTLSKKSNCILSKS